MTHNIRSVIADIVHDAGSTMSSRPSVHTPDTVKVPNHTILYGIVLTTVGVLVVLGGMARLYELREFFPLRLPDQVNEFILNYVPFIVGTFVTSVAALAGVIVGLSWIFSGLGHVGRIRVTLGGAGDFYRPTMTSLAVKEGKIDSYKKPPTLLFWLLSIAWKNTKYLSEISRQIVKWNARFLWKMLALGIVIHFLFRAMELLPPYLASIGLGTGYVLPSPVPFYNLLIAACICKVLISLSLVPLKKPVVGREMDSMIVEGRGHPSVFFCHTRGRIKDFCQARLPQQDFQVETVCVRRRRNPFGHAHRKLPRICEDHLQAGGVDLYACGIGDDARWLLANHPHAVPDLLRRIRGLSSGFTVSILPWTFS